MGNINSAMCWGADHRLAEDHAVELKNSGDAATSSPAAFTALCCTMVMITNKVALNSPVSVRCHCLCCADKSVRDSSYEGPKGSGAGFKAAKIGLLEE